MESVDRSRVGIKNDPTAPSDIHKSLTEATLIFQTLLAALVVVQDIRGGVETRRSQVSCERGDSAATSRHELRIAIKSRG